MKNEREEEGKKSGSGGDELWVEQQQLDSSSSSSRSLKREREKRIFLPFIFCLFLSALKIKLCIEAVSLCLLVVMCFVVFSVLRSPDNEAHMTSHLTLEFPTPDNRQRKEEIAQRDRSPQISHLLQFTNTPRYAAAVAIGIRKHPRIHKIMVYPIEKQKSFDK